jgi:hypothetical protein
LLDKIGDHPFRATGITTYLKNGGMLENAAAMANHAYGPTGGFALRRSQRLPLDEPECHLAVWSRYSS